jgi:hypothetical protein
VAARDIATLVLDDHLAPKSWYRYTKVWSSGKSWRKWRELWVIGFVLGGNYDAVVKVQQTANRRSKVLPLSISCGLL